ncbi:MAG: porin [Verrucomicrobiota bacterium]
MNTKMTKVALALTAGLALASAPAYAEGNSNWIDAYKSMGKVYSDKENPMIQEVKLFGRAHYQWNHSDGESAGFDFSGNGEELRRLRAGASVKLLDGFKVLGRANLEKGGFRNTSIGYNSFDELYVEYGQDGLFGFDAGSIGYGRYKVAFGGEEHVSSKRIKTVERSNINNRFGSLRPTGVVLKGAKNDVEYVAGIYSTEADRETWANWDGATAFQGSAIFAANEGEVTLDFMYADSSADNDRSIFDFEWAASATYNRKYGEWNVLANATFGKDDGNDIFGIVILPTYPITEKLEAAFRYQFASSSAMTGVPKSSSSRGLRRVARNDGVGTGSGDENHTLYAGLNYYIEGDNLKLMTGIEYESIDGAPGLGIDGFTFWTALRTYF